MKKFWETVNLSELTARARRFFEESDRVALASIFGECRNVSDIEAVAEDLYNDVFGGDEE